MFTSLTFVITTGLLCQIGATKPTDPEPQNGKAIERAVLELGDPRFAVRNEASDFLWHQGLPAEAALRQAARSDDLEVRSRAGRILSDFDYGILPSVPAHVAQWIRQFRDGNAPARQQALLALGQDEQWQTVLSLLRREADVEARRRLLVMAFKNAAVLERYGSVEQITRLVESIAPEQPLLWRRGVAGQLLFSAPMIERLAEADKLSALTEFLKAEQDPQVRTLALNTLFGNPASVNRVVNEGRSPLLNTLLNAATAPLRSRLLVQVLGNQQAVARIIHDEQLEPFLKLLKSLADEPNSLTLLSQLFQSPGMPLILDERGAEYFVQWIGGEQDGVERGNRFAALMSSHVVQQWLLNAGKTEMVVNIAANRLPAAARREYISRVLRFSGASLLGVATVQRKFWDLIKADEDPLWQVNTIMIALHGGRMREVATEEAETLWLLEMSSKAGAAAGGPLLQTITGDREWLSLMVQQGHLETILDVVKSIESTQRMLVLSRLVQNPATVDYLRSKDQVSRLIELAQEEMPEADHTPYLRSLISNREAVVALIEQGYYPMLVDRILAGDQSGEESSEAAERRAALFANLVGHADVAAYLAREEELETIVEFADSQPSTQSRDAFLRPLFGSAAMPVLLEHGHYERFRSYLDDETPQRESLIAAFYGSPPVLQYFLQQHETADLIALVDALGQSAQEPILQRLANDRAIVVRLMEEDQFERFVALVAQNPNANLRAGILSNVFAVPDLMQRLADSDQLGIASRIVREESDLPAKQQLLRVLCSSPQGVAAWIKAGQLSDLIDLAETMTDPVQKAGLFVMLVNTQSLLDHWAGEERLGAVLELADSFDDAAGRQQYLSQIYGNYRVLNALLEAGLFERLLQMAQRQPAEIRGPWLRSLGQNPATTGYLSAEGRIDRLLEIVVEEPDEAVRHVYLDALVANRQAVTSLLGDGHYQALTASIFSLTDSVQRARVYGRLSQHSGVVAHLAERKLLPSLLEFAEREQNKEAQAGFLKGFILSSALDALLEQGQYERVRALVEQASPLRDSLVATFYSSPPVLTRLVERGEYGEVFEHAKGLEQTARSEFLRRLLLSPALASATVRAGHLEAMLSLIRSEPVARQRTDGFQRLLASTEVLTELVAQEQLQRVADAAIDAGDATSQLASALAHRDVVEIWVRAEMLDQLIQLISQSAHRAQHADLLARVVGSGSVLRLWGKRDELEKVFTLADQGGVGVRESYLQRVLSDRAVMSELIAAGMFEDVLAVVGSLRTSRAHAAVLEMISRDASVAKHLISSGQTARLLSLGRDEDSAEARLGYIQGLVYNHQAIVALVEAGHYDALVELVMSVQDSPRRATLFGRLIQQPSVAGHLVEQKELDQLLEFAEAQSSPGARAAFLQYLFSSSSMTHLIARGHYDRLWVMIDGSPTSPGVPAAIREEVVAHFLANEKVFERFQLANELVDVIERVAAMDSADARYSFLQQASSRSDQLRILIDRGYAEAIAEIILRDPEDYHRQNLIGRIILSPETVKHFAAAEDLPRILSILREERSGELRARLLHQLIANQDSTKHFIQAGLFPALVSLISALPDADERGRILGTLLGTAAVAEHLISKGNTDTALRILKQARERSDSHAVRALAETLLRDPQAMSRWSEAGLLDRLIDLAASDADLDHRAHLLGRLVVTRTVLDQWSEDERLRTLLALADSIARDPEAEPRQKYLGYIFRSAPAMQALIDAGLFEDLLQIAVASGQSDPQRTLLALLLRSAPVALYLRAQGRVELIMELVRREQDSAARDALLTAVVENDVAVTAIVSARQFDPLVDLVREQPAGVERRSALALFLRSSIAVETLAESGELESLVQAVLADLDQQVRSDFLQQLLRQETALNAIQRIGMFDDLVHAIEQADAVTRRDLLDRILQTQGGAQLLVEHNRTPLVIEALRDNRQESRAAGVTVHRLVGEPQFLRAVATQKYLGPFLDAAEAVHRDAGSAAPFGTSSLWESVRLSSEITMVLVENDQIGRVLDAAVEHDRPYLLHTVTRSLLGSEAFDALERPQLAARLVSAVKQAATQPNSLGGEILLADSGLRQTMIADGQTEGLLELLAMVRNEAQRERLREEILYSATGAVANHIQQEGVDQAQQLLEQQAAETDQGIAMLSSFLLTQDRLTDRIAELEQRGDEHSRLLAYLHRAAGDLDAALAAATRSGDAALIHYITCERRDWLSAAKQLTVENILPPVPLRRPEQFDEQAQIERLGFLAAYWRLAGDAEQAEQVLQQIRQFAAAHKEHPHLRRCAAEALLLNGQVQPGLKALEQAVPLQAFEALVARGECAAALAAIGCAPDSAFDHAWYLNLPLRESGDTFSDALIAAEHRMDFAMRVAEVLRQYGYDDRAEQIVRTLEMHAQEQPERTSEGHEWRRMHEQWLAADLYRMGFHERAWRHADGAITHSTYEMSLVYSMFTGRAKEAGSWWTYYRTTAEKAGADESVQETLRQVHQVLDLGKPSAGEEFEQLVQRAAALFGGSEGELSRHVVGLADTCIRRGRLDLAEPFLYQSRQQDWTTRMKLADVLRRQQKWDEAGEVLHKVWKSDGDQLAALYLSGDSLVRAGDATEGERRKQLASSLALRSGERHRMAIALEEAGLAADAMQQFTIVTRTAPLAHWEVNDSLRRIADHVHLSAPTQAADHWEQYTLSMLRTNLRFDEVRFYLRMPYLIHWRRAATAIEQGDENEVLRQAQMALDSMCLGSQLGQELVLALEQKGYEDTAESLYDSVRQHYVESLEEFPESAHLHNELAWLDARCSRNLDEALTHAQRAVEIRPRHAGYIDTLAEVHYQRGDSQQAIELSQQSVNLLPTNETFRARLEHFQNDPLPE